MDNVNFINFENQLKTYIENDDTFNTLLTFIKVSINENLINCYVRLPYNKYLLTSYWYIIASLKIKESGYKCTECGNKEMILQVHHKTYKHRGLEFIFMNDLIVLCEICHAKAHHKKVDILV